MNNMANLLLHKKCPLQLILDEQVLYLEDSLESVMVRGEVIVSFPKDTHIQGPIELLFEGIQRFIPWPAIMVNRPLGGPLETKLQTIELSLLPPNNQGYIPAGVHRFPFEFPIPSSLPTTVHIANRLSIFYRLTASLRRSVHADGHWLDKARHTMSKKKLTATAGIRLLRAIESVCSLAPRLAPPPTTTTLHQSITTNPTVPLESEHPEHPSSDMIVSDPWARQNRTSYRLSLDEQHDLLAFSMAGRTAENLNVELNPKKDRGIRYQLSVDRTAIALGTSVGVRVMLEPTLQKMKLQSVVLVITQMCEYTIRIPENHMVPGKAETRYNNEASKVVLKWAYGYADDESKSGTPSPSHRPDIRPYLHRRFANETSGPYRTKTSTKWPEQARWRTIDPDEKDAPEQAEVNPQHTQGQLLNLKNIGQDIEVGEYFSGRFVLPIPACDHMLYPSIEHDGAVKIHHWLKLAAVVRHGNETFEISLDSPMRMLDCRLVSPDDERQTILPPPPSYSPSEHTREPMSFWEQRQPITLQKGWGTCDQCPCQIKRSLAKKKEEKENQCASLQPEQGPPPRYSER
ncbi:uncharacterized protein BYT42DRAFT_599294 [Radiomyces spectabilis]|uniref:uncharacterized protein n=1 Tax=Radiomyces spectabilis TaxID=64574 RepID=UPI00221E7923|nr:uncharacterized protein BYT42DRAFT_599294 [Radiomyces spectabilis]KAI8374168.1 hypothetical protein BYT42DRAFT_599294 [Radiomyces spectabilis]